MNSPHHSGSPTVEVESDDPMVIVCAGPPLCTLDGDAAVAAGAAGCALCKRIICHPDGSETVIERTVN